MKQLIGFSTGFLLLLIAGILFTWQGGMILEGKAQLRKAEQQEKVDTAEVKPQEETAASSSATIQWDSTPEKGERIGILRIPEIGMKEPILQGTSDKELDQGIGHHMSTGLPGENTRVVLGGHREDPFKQLGDLKAGDRLYVETSHGEVAYKVEKTWVTSAEDQTIVVAKREPTLILYSCFPFVEGASTDKRYIVQARLIR